MNWLEAKMKWIMLLSGFLTIGMVYAALSPQAALQSMFGEALHGPLADIIVRNWGALVALIGAMLIYGAFNPASRSLVLVIAGLSKAIFIGLILSHGSRYVGQQVGVGLILDSIMVVVFAAYLLGSRRDMARNTVVN